MYKSIQLVLGYCLVSLLGLSTVVAGSCLPSLKQKPLSDGDPLFDTLSGLSSLNDYLIKSVNSTELVPNRDAVDEYLFVEWQAEMKKKDAAKWSYLMMKKKKAPTRENDMLHAAEMLGNLMKVKMWSKCDEVTLKHLERLLYVHRFQTRPWPEPPRRFNLTGMERISELTEAILNDILVKCDESFNDMFVIKWLELEANVKDTIEQSIGLYRINNLVNTTSLAEQIDLQNYKTALESRDKAKFAKYYKRFFEQHLLRPCHAFRQHLAPLMELAVEIERSCSLLHTPSPKFRGLPLWKECTRIVGRPIEEVHEEAGQVVDNYIDNIH